MPRPANAAPNSHSQLDRPDSRSPRPSPPFRGRGGKGQLPPRAEEGAQKLPRRPLADAAIDLRPVVAGRLSEEAGAMLDGAALRVAGAEIEPAEPGEGDRRRAHGAGLERDIEISTLQALQPGGGRRLAD